MRTIRKPLALALLAALVVAGAPAAARAAELFTYSFDVDSGAAGRGIDLGIALSVMTGVESPDWATVSFGRFADGDEGRTVTLTDSTASDFDRVVERLTDGTRHVMLFEWMTRDGGGGGGSSEPAAIWGDADDPRVDLAGFVIDSLALRADRLTFTEETRPSGPWTAVSGTFTLSAEGRPVPEPAGAMVALPVLAVLLRRSR